MKISKSQTGFTPVHLLLLLVLIGIIGFTGWKVYDTSKFNETASSSTLAPTTDMQQAEPDDEAESWKLVTSSKNGFSVRIPDGWLVFNDTGSEWVLQKSATRLEYIKGKAPVVEDTEIGGFDGGAAFSIRLFQPDDRFNYLNGDEQKQEFVTTKGLKGSRYYMQQPVAEPPEGIGPLPGQKDYIYEFKKDGKTLYVTYRILERNEFSATNVPATEPDRLALIEQVVKTIELK